MTTSNAPRTASARQTHDAAKHDLFASDFGRTLSFSDSGFVLSETFGPSARKPHPRQNRRS